MRDNAYQFKLNNYERVAERDDSLSIGSDLDFFQIKFKESKIKKDFSEGYNFTL